MLCALVHCQAACVVFPAPVLPDTIDSTIKGRQLQPIEPGRSGRGQIIEHFGPPQWASTDDSQWKYEMRRYYPWGLGLCFGLYPGWGDCLEFVTLKVEILEVSFDESGTVEDLETPSFTLEECIESGECSFLVPGTRGLKTSDAWFIESSHFDLVEHDGLLYEAGASLPFTGTKSSYYESGTRASEFRFEMGLKHGPCTIWYEDGSIYKTMTYEIDSLHGVVSYFGRFGNEYWTECYSDGVRTDTGASAKGCN